MGNLTNVIGLLNLFRKGEEVANSEAWKDRGNLITVLVPALVLATKIAGDHGYGIALSTEDATTLALGVVSVVQFVIHNVTSARAGVLPAKAAE